jgi:Leucine-rich repeat (LRR) protein
MKLLLLIISVSALLPISAQDWRYMKGKKLFTSLEEANKTPVEVYNLHLNGRDLYKKDFSGISKMINLRFLALESAGLKDLPKGFFDPLIRLKTISLVDNKFTSIPEGISKLKQLEYLVMYDNEIDSIPDWIGELSALETLILNRNKLVYISPAIGLCKKMKDLSLGQNLLEQIPGEIGKLELLEDLELENNQLPVLPESICGLKKLVAIQLGGNKLLRLPENIGQLERLENLQLSENNLQNLPLSVGRLRRLDNLNLSKNFSFQWDDKLELPPSLRQLSLEGIQLKNVPACIRRCTRLENIDLTTTSLQEIPVWIGALKNLGWLIFDDNNISHIPSDIYKLRKLEVLRLESNQVDTIPGEVFLFPELRVFAINHNPVRHIPAEILQAKKLKSFDMLDTQIPYPEYRKFRKLLPSRVEIAHNSPYYFEEDNIPCYRDINTKNTDAAIFTKSEMEPYYWGGNTDWQKFVLDNMDTSVINQYLNSPGVKADDSVVLKFIVHREGGIGNLSIINAPNSTIRKEVKRIMEISCPYWAPANMGGRSVNAWYSLVIIFRVNEDNGIRELSVNIKSPAAKPVYE